MKTFLRLSGLMSVLLATPSLHAQGLKRFILSGGSLDANEAAAEKMGGRKFKRLKYFKATVVELPQAAVDALARRLGDDVRIEEDLIYDNDAERGRTQGKPGSGGGGSGGGGGTTQPPQATGWGVNAIKAPAAWTATKGAGVVVCVVDSGVDKTHPDLSANILGGENFVGASPNPADWVDYYGHGTHVSGIIAALDNGIGVVGVAPEAKIFMARVADAKGGIATSDFAEGVMACANRDDVKVINMSLKSYSSTLLMQAFDLATQKGIYLVASAGNSNYFTFPAQDKRTWAISAVDQNMKHPSWAAVASGDWQYGRMYVAPGVGIVSTANGGGYESKDGTSMSAAFFSGVAALRAAASSLGFMADYLNLPPEQQGTGLVNAQGTANFR